MNDNNDADEADELEFRLFATPAAPSTKPTTTTPTPQQKSTASAPIQKIRLRSPSLDPDQPGGFTNPSRPHSYYFAPALDDDASSVQKRGSAVSGADVLARAARIWRGCAVPWRVTVLDLSGRKLARVCKGHGEPVADGGGVGGSDDDGARQPGRRRKSKKARVALRKKHAKGLERMEAAARAAREKEEAERAKRMEKNRKQKLKRREKERARKAGERGEAGGGGGGGGGGDVVMGEGED
ncbi:hypothetical protein BK809_0005232 [Diplodia seriata]|uniref:Uncharacterized protein n=1 Tax=Diplodia seriata TaxID=420778 RepID=A0A1S8B9C7_9PEZI|nr:hypothetical protein BK809_0005232 [Diplodia seriata]